MIIMRYSFVSLVARQAVCLGVVFFYCISMVSLPCKCSYILLCNLISLKNVKWSLKSDGKKTQIRTRQRITSHLIPLNTHRARHIWCWKPRSWHGTGNKPTYWLMDLQWQYTYKQTIKLICTDSSLYKKYIHYYKNKWHKHVQYNIRISEGF